MPLPSYQRAIGATLKARLDELPRQIQILAGPRQVGKTTLIEQLLSDPGRPMASRHLIAADNAIPLPDAASDVHATTRMQPRVDAASAEWLAVHWHYAEAQAHRWSRTARDIGIARPFVFVIDEVQRVPDWSRVVKGLWDASRAHDAPMHVVLLGSSPLLMQQGLTESLAGRFELIPMKHWSFEEMSDAFDFTLDEYVYFGGFPGSARFIRDEARWRDYVRDALIEPNIQRDVLAMARVDNPALLRLVFEVGCNSSGQILALDKLRGRLGGHTNTLAHYIDLLRHAGLLSGLPKHAKQTMRQRAAPPKFQVHNTALMSVASNYTFATARADRSYWGRLVESTVGAHLINTADPLTRVEYWREGNLEVDFVLEHHGVLAALEVKSGAAADWHRGLAEFGKRYPSARTCLIGDADSELPLGEFLRHPARYWTQ